MLCTVFLTLTQLRYRYKIVAQSSSAQQVSCFCIISPLHGSVTTNNCNSTSHRSWTYIVLAIPSMLHFTLHAMAMLIVLEADCGKADLSTCIQGTISFHLWCGQAQKKRACYPHNCTSYPVRLEKLQTIILQYTPLLSHSHTVHHFVHCIRMACHRICTPN